MMTGLENLLLSSFFDAEVVKLANTLRSGRSGRKLLRVQLPPSAFLTGLNKIKRRFVYVRQTEASVLRRP